MQRRREDDEGGGGGEEASFSSYIFTQLTVTHSIDRQDAIIVQSVVSYVSRLVLL